MATLPRPMGQPLMLLTMKDGRSHMVYGLVYTCGHIDVFTYSNVRDVANPQILYVIRLPCPGCGGDTWRSDTPYRDSGRVWWEAD